MAPVLGLLFAGAATSDAPEWVAKAVPLLAALPEGQRDEAVFAFDDEEREDIHYAPFFIDGVRLGDLSPENQRRVASLLDAVLSSEGSARVRTIRELERDVLEKERGGLRGLVTRSIRDPERYFLAFFGDPAAPGPWGFRFEGHHVSLNVTSVPGGPSGTTPLFLGAEPREVPKDWPSAGVRALGREEDLLRELVGSLDVEQHERAMLTYEDGRGHMLGQVRRVEVGGPAGLARSAMTPTQRELLDAVLECFVSLWNADIAAARRSELGDRDDIHFAWAESTEPRGAFYARLQGPGLLLEIDNTEDGDHVHAVWHRPGADFGDDLLVAHYAREHGVALVPPVREIPSRRDAGAVERSGPESGWRALSGASKAPFAP